MGSEGGFRDEAERLAAMSSCFGLCGFLDHNVGRMLKALADTGALVRTRHSAGEARRTGRRAWRLVRWRTDR